jgi:hypothetical protein
VAKGILAGQGSDAHAHGAIGRSPELIFVGVMQDTAVFLTIGDHNSFDDGTISKLMDNHLRATVVGCRQLAEWVVNMLCP